MLLIKKYIQDVAFDRILLIPDYLKIIEEVHGSDIFILRFVSFLQIFISQNVSIKMMKSHFKNDYMIVHVILKINDN